MATAKQTAANRLNAKKPRTAQATSASRFNALKHGIYAERLVMFEEKAEDLADLAAEYHEQHAPANPTERSLVDTLIHNEWRLRRLRRVEADLWQRGYNTFVVTSTVAEIDNDALNTCTSGDAFAAEPAIFDRLQRIVNGCERNYHRALKELQAAQAQPRDQRTPQPMESTASSADLAAFRQTPNPAPPAQPPTPKKQAGGAEEMDDETFFARLAEIRANSLAKYGKK